MKDITKAIWKNNILHYGIVILAIFIIGYASATTITNNRISNVIGVGVDLTDKITNISISSGSITDGVGTNIIDNDIGTSMTVEAGSVIDIAFDRKYILTHIYLNGNSIDTRIVNYVSINGNYAIIYWDCYESPCFIAGTLSSSKQQYGNYLTLDKRGSYPLTINEIKIYGIDTGI